MIQNKEIELTLSKLELFYQNSPEVRNSESHGFSHAMNVYNHAVNAVECISKKSILSTSVCTEIMIAALLHDVDDSKYYGKKEDEESNNMSYPNAYKILSSIDAISIDSITNILYMISLVSCSKNGNSVPVEIEKNHDYHLLIPRWSDRLEAVGAIGVVRCYQYCKEKKQPLYSMTSPKATTIEEVWEYATPDRFEEYQKSEGHSDDMISHYYDKLLHIARPPKAIVRNEYLERAAENSVQEMVKVCIAFGKTGVVDEEYIKSLEST